jgi:SAM-dependent methyltransferase
MGFKDMTEKNRAAWNEAQKYHRQARNNSLQTGFENPDFTVFDRDCDKMLWEKLALFALSGKTIGQLPCDNGRELLALMRLGAKAGYGFDISDAAIEEAKQLAEIANLNATFERVNILEIGDEYNRMFDFIYISEGSLQWFSDPCEYFKVIARLLKTGGRILIYEIHPIAYMIDYGGDLERQNYENLTSYFDRGPHSYPDGIDYVGGVKYEARECYSFLHKMSDIVNAILQNGLSIQEFEEYNMEMENNETAARMDKFPLSYMIVGEKM